MKITIGSSVFGLQRVMASVIVGMAVLTSTACKDVTDAIPKGGGSTYVRYINGVYQEVPGIPTSLPPVVDGDGTVTTVLRTPVTYVARSIDVLLDSISSGTPSSIGQSPNAVSAGTAGPVPGNVSDAGYYEVERGIHSFVARRNGVTPDPGFSFFTTSRKTQYLPKQYLLSGTPYTLLVSGILVADSDTGQVINPYSNIEYSMLRDEPFSPPVIRGVNGAPDKLQASFRVYNVAPIVASGIYVYYGSMSMSVYMRPGTAAPDSLNTMAPLADGANFNDASLYTNVSPGTYYVAIAFRSGRDVTEVWGEVVTFKPGEVRSFIVTNAMPTFTVTTVQTTVTPPVGSPRVTTTREFPAPTFKVISTIDNQW